MFQDVIALSKGIGGEKVVSKETLNHAGLLYLASGIDPYADTRRAYMEAYRSLGIDLFGRVPEENKTSSLQDGELGEEENGYRKGYLGFYETVSRTRYPYADVDDFLDEEKFRLDYNKLITPVPHKLDLATIERKTALGKECGLFYYMYYTTLYMWGVEWLGPEVFLTAIALDAERVNDCFLRAAFEESKKAIRLLSEVKENPFVFIHDDLADARGPVCSHGWYENYIFPKYKELFAIAHERGKKIIFTIDGNCECFLQDLLDCGADGIMPETPATDFDKILNAFGDKIVIGGMNGKILCHGTPRAVAKETDAVLSKTRGVKGFALSAPCGLHGSIPLENLEAYFDTRAKFNVNPKDWRKAKK